LIERFGVLADEPPPPPHAAHKMRIKHADIIHLAFDIMISSSPPGKPGTV
jgi:hypothetical protein